MDHGWIKIGDTHADMLESFFPSDIAIRGLRKGSKQPQNAIHRAYVAISGSGSSMPHPLTKWPFRRFRLSDFSRLGWNKTECCSELVMTMHFMDYAGIFVISFRISDIWQNMPKIA